MNAYSWGTLADDYTYLEDIGRNVANWGRGIVNLNKGRGGRGPRGRSVLPPKCETLRVQLAARDIEIRFVPDGMEKRRLSQSSWDVRCVDSRVYVSIGSYINLFPLRLCGIAAREQNENCILDCGICVPP
jgi:hypothetical protein